MSDENDMPLFELVGKERYDKGLRQARRRAAWELGTPGWANVIIQAFSFPEIDAEDLAMEMDDSD